MVSACQQLILYHIRKKEPQANFSSKRGFLRVGLQVAYIHYSNYFCRSLSFGGNSDDINTKNSQKNHLQEEE